MQTRLALKKIACCISVMAVMQLIYAQAPTHTGKFSPVLDVNINGFYEYLPRNYATDVSTKYPLIVFFHANGESGSTADLATLNRVKAWGPPKLIDNGSFPDSFNVGGRWFKFIVITPQIKEGLDWTSVTPDPAKNVTADAVIEYAKAAYRVDPARIYVCGMSMGGGIAWSYAGSSAAAAGKLAAVVVACGSEVLTTNGANTIAASNLPVLATHNKGDNTIPYERTDNNVALINAYIPAIAPTPKLVKWDDGDHNVWSRTYEDINPGITSMDLDGNLRDSLGVNAYEWLLQFTRTSAALPVKWQSFTVRAIDGAAVLRWTITEPINTLSYTVEKSSDAVSWISLATLQAQTNTGIAQDYQFTDAPTQSTFFYRIRQTDLDGTYHYSAVQKFTPSNTGMLLKIFPNPFRNQFVVQYAGVPQKKIMIKLVDAAGRIFLTQAHTIEGGTDSIVLDNLGHLATGIYYAIIEDEAGVMIARTKLLKE